MINKGLFKTLVNILELQCFVQHNEFNMLISSNNLSKTKR